MRCAPLICWLATLLPPVACAQGLDFAAMPVGLQMHYQGSENRRWVELYLGPVDGYHVIERRRGSAYGALMQTRFYDAEGHEVARITDTGQRRFNPRHCLRVQGPCQMQVRDSNSGNHMVHATLHRQGDGYHYKWKVAGQIDDMRAHYRLGAYNLPVWSRSNDYLVVLTEIVEPGGPPLTFAR